MANKVVNNWQSIGLTSLSNDIKQSFSNFNSVSYYSMTNTILLGIY